MTRAAGEHWAPASFRTASIFVGARNGDGSADQTRFRSAAPEAAAVGDTPPRTPRTADDYNLLVERFLQSALCVVRR